MRIDAATTPRALLRETLDHERFASTVMGTFAALALILAAVGLYGVVSQVVGRRTREIGIRIALGARSGGIATTVLGRTGGATAVGIGAGAVLAVAGTRLLADRMVGLEAASPGTYALAGAALVLTALLAAYGPVRKAVRVDPVRAIRAESLGTPT